MSIKSRVTALEQESSGSGEPARVCVVRFPATVSVEEWTRAARAHASGQPFTLPMREIRYVNGRRADGQHEH